MLVTPDANELVFRMNGQLTRQERRIRAALDAYHAGAFALIDRLL